MKMTFEDFYYNCLTMGCPIDVIDASTGELLLSSSVRYCKNGEFLDKHGEDIVDFVEAKYNTLMVYINVDAD